MAYILIFVCIIAADVVVPAGKFLGISYSTLSNKFDCSVLDVAIYYSSTFYAAIYFVSSNKYEVRREYLMFSFK